MNLRREERFIENVEAFIVCRDYAPPDGFEPSMYSVFDLTYDKIDQLVGINREIVPFLACGDLNGFDSDRTYPLTVTRMCLRGFLIDVVG